MKLDQPKVCLVGRKERENELLQGPFCKKDENESLIPNSSITDALGWYVWSTLLQIGPLIILCYGVLIKCN